MCDHITTCVYITTCIYSTYLVGGDGRLDLLQLVHQGVVDHLGGCGYMRDIWWIDGGLWMVIYGGGLYGGYMVVDTWWFIWWFMDVGVERLYICMRWAYSR